VILNKGVPQFDDATLIHKKLDHLVLDHIWRYLKQALAEFPFLKLGMTNDVNQTAGKVLLSKLKV
jgi:hypothetical protein